MKSGFIRAALVTGAALYIFTGVALLFAPEWFFANIGTFPPYNRHYLGDVGAFTLPLGLALLWAARQPARHSLTIGLVGLASLVHTLNHAYDDLQAGTPFLTSQTLPLLFVAVVLLAAYVMVVRDKQPV